MVEESRKTIKKIAALCPARSGSKRLKNKNILPLGGKPLLLWTLEAAKESGLFDRVILSTDSQEYAEIGQRAADEIIMRGEMESGDGASDYLVVAHALAECPGLDEFDLIAYLRPTTPFRKADVMQAAIDAFGDDFTSLRSVEEMPESAYKSFRYFDRGLQAVSGEFDPNLPNQAVPVTYRGNGHIDLIRPDYVIRQAELWGPRCQAFVTSRVVEIDTEEDFRYAEWVIGHGLAK